MLYRFAFLLLVLALGASVFAQNQVASVDQATWTAPPAYLSSQPDPASGVDGYLETQVKSEHITPRGLIIADHGVEVQPAAGLTFNLYEGTGLLDKVTTTEGVWNSVNSSLDIPTAGSWFEIDYFARLNFQLAKRINLAVQYVAFDSPGEQFATDNNIETTLGYDDMGLHVPDFAFRPYARVFYNVSGGSTTLLGSNGDTYDAELGFVPTYIWKGIRDCPVTFTLPTYVTVGPQNFWGGQENVGIFTTSLAASIPMNFVPARFGRWHWDISASYFNLLNGKLVDAAETLGNGRDRTRAVGEIGIGMDF